MSVMVAAGDAPAAGHRRMVRAETEEIVSDFWAAIDAQLAELRTAKTADDVIRILDAPSAGDAFFAGSGGDGSVREALTEAGWQVIWAEASYYYVMRAPGGDVVTYVEGDVYRGDVARRS